MKREELIQSKEYWIAKLQIDLFNEVENYMQKNKLNRTQFAEKLGVSKGYISQILNGDSDHRISKLVEISLAIGLIPNISFESMRDLLERESNGGFGITKQDIEKSKSMLLQSGYLTSHRPVFDKSAITETNNADVNVSNWLEIRKMETKPTGDKLTA